MSQKKSTFIDKIVAAHKAQPSAWESLGLDLDEEDKKIAGINEDDLIPRATVVYKKIVDKAAEDKQAKLRAAASKTRPGTGLQRRPSSC